MADTETNTGVAVPARAGRASPEPASSLGHSATIANALVVKAPQLARLKGAPSVFLAGSIDMGKAENWQERVTAALLHMPVTIFNPRRDDWDATWVQDISNPQFRQQVNWELNRLDEADLIAMYFDPNGPAPISLLELGAYADSEKMIVCCPAGYWRRGNVQIVCARYGIELFDSIDDFVPAVAKAMEARSDETRSGSARQGDSAAPKGFAQGAGQ